MLKSYAGSGQGHSSLPLPVSGGTGKEAIYHHFKSKEEIMDALSEKMFTSNNPFEAVKKRTDLNALEQMRLAIKLNQADEKQVELTRQAIPLLKNPKVLASMLESNRKFLCPYWQELIEEGQKDGSIQTQYPKELAEFLILMDLWLLPTIFPADEEGIHNRHKFIFQLLEKIGLPLYDQEIGSLLESLPYFSNEQGD